MSAHKQNHKQNAFDALNAAYSQPSDAHEVACGNAAAVVEATLYLAEQQRIANLIAYASHRIEHKNALGAHDYAEALRSLLGEADFAIREGLGL